MKSAVIGVLLVFVSMLANGQDELKSTGIFGNHIDNQGAISVRKLPGEMENSETVEIKVKGIVTEVCQAKGCWMTLDMGDDESIRVKFKDYGFFVPKDAAGKTAIVQGIATKELVSVEEQKHLAEDAGKSEKEINSIKEPKEELTFVAEGVIIK